MKNSSRRTLLKSFAAAGVGALFIPNFIGCAPSQKLRFAMIGVGARGKASWSQVAKDDIVAMCDVDDRMSAEAYKAVPNAKKYKDFRVMYDEMANEIDAVMIATPDHTHFAAAIIAMQLGKHVLVEKPLVHNIWQCRTMKKAAKYYGIVSQMANQGHTTHGIRLAKEWYEAGVLGEVKEVIRWGAPTTFKPNGYFSHPGEFPFPEHEVPKELDWDLWKGPAADRPFNDEYVPRSWRGFYDFGSGGMADWCCHSLDAPFWSLDLGMPYTVDAVIPEREVPDHSMVAQKSTITWQFGARGNKPPVTMKWIEGMGKPELKDEYGLKEMPSNGLIMVGSKKTLYHGERPNNPRLLVPEEEWEHFKKNRPAQTIPRVEEEKPVQEWVAAIKNDTLPGSNFDYGADLTEMGLIGVLAQRFGGTIKYDAKNMKAVGRPELDAYIKEPVREGWSYGEDLW